ncbi:P-loop containing nucleoside triphosphate hydrolase protein [Mrakia frigida]|uniref:P-loop containing nucleoside triphosphate hydrolase protein n=1 Tax=Mrakia frigida TaxID=29902 RepID=UPI003FCC25A4
MAKSMHNKGKPVLPTAMKKRKDPGVPKFPAIAAKKAEQKAVARAENKERWREKARAHNPAPRSFANISTTSTPHDTDLDPASAYEASTSTDFMPLDPSIMLKDSSAKAFMNHLRRVIDQSDVIIQVLDARDPLGGRSKFVEEEVRRREGDGKKLIAVVNKIDLVPRPAVEAWLRYLRHDFPTLPFKSSTQSQRNHISSLHLPTATTANPTAPTTTPVTSLALGATPLIQLLKTYARHLPTGQSLTVGVVGFPNVGKSSLINSLKRSRACGVAATPGHTRVVQEVALDKGVKILDCPGIVFDPAGEEPGMPEEERRRKRGEVILRNCVKAELVEDVISPVEIITTKVDHSKLEKLYGVPPFENVTQLLVSIALVRGRLGKVRRFLVSPSPSSRRFELTSFPSRLPQGGVPDLESSAVQVLRDWNSGKIAYHTVPPAVHPSSLLRPSAAKASPFDIPSSVVPVASSSSSSDMFPSTFGTTEGTATGDAAIVKSFAPAFDMGALFGQADREVFEDGEEGGMDVEVEAGGMGMEDEMPVDEEFPDEEGDEAWGGLDDYIGMGVLKEEVQEVVVQKKQERQAVEDNHPRPPPLQYPSTVLHKSNTTSLRRLFTPEEMLNMSVGNPMNRKNLKAEKKRKEREARRHLGGGGGGGEPMEEMSGGGGGDSRSAEERFMDMMED